MNLNEFPHEPTLESSANSTRNINPLCFPIILPNCTISSINSLLGSRFPLVSEAMSSFSRCFQILRASLIAQLVKNPPAMQEIPVGFLGWENLLEKG